MAVQKPQPDLASKGGSPKPHPQLDLTVSAKDMFCTDCVDVPQAQSTLGAFALIASIGDA
jgi:hypothetical protein